jgi:release factor glutamine methyltransferase
MQYTTGHVRDQMAKMLIPQYGESEAGQMVKMLFDHFCGISGAGMVLRKNELLTQKQFEVLMQANNDLSNHIPVQYVIGSAWFAGLNFEVNPSVLIPRPETEELVDLILSEVLHLPPDADNRILDIGTGSGCIAVALQKTLIGWKAEACDISDEALSLAQRNASNAGTEILFFKGDILQWNKWPDKGLYNIIVSNPPYVCEHEKSLMQPNVLENEPALALFVPDDDPLIFYRAIAGFADSHLSENGKLFLEINESFGSEIKDLLGQIGFVDIDLRKDFRGKDRFVSAFKV